MKIIDDTIDAPKEPKLILTVEDILNLDLPVDDCLLGDEMIAKGKISLLAGPGGIGKSRATTNLALQGALFEEGAPSSWMGFKLQRGFRTLIVQSENGLKRLQAEYKKFPKRIYGDSLITMRPLKSGINLSSKKFRRRLKEAIALTRPDLVIFDPWSDCCDGIGQQPFKRAHKYMVKVIGCDPDSPAVLIVTHVRKPKRKKTVGLSLLHEVVGTQALVSKARSVLVMRSLSDDVEDRRIGLSCLKNNDGEKSSERAWLLEDGNYVEVEGVDDSSADDESRIREDKILSLFRDGEPELKGPDIVKALKGESGFGRTAVYDLLASLLESGKLVKKPGRILALPDRTESDENLSDSDGESSDEKSSDSVHHWWTANGRKKRGARSGPGGPA